MHKITNGVVGFALVLSLVLALMLAAEAQGSCYFLRGDEKGSTYVLLEGTYDSGATTSYSDANCENEHGPWEWGDGGAAYADSEEEARAICRSNAGSSYNVAARIQDGGNLWGCGNGGVSSRTNGGRRSGSSRTIVPTPKPVVYTGEVLQQLGEHISAEDGMRSGIQFQRPGTGGIGIEWVIDEGVIDAMDVWGNAGRGYEVCFTQAGRWIFLDAGQAPRRASWEGGYRRDGLSCLFMDRAGTVVLVSPSEKPVAEPTVAATPAPIPTIDPATLDDIVDAIALEDCTVRPHIDVNLRQDPWGQILDVIPTNTEVAAAARTDSWFNVTYEETEGWIAAWLVNTDGDCDWIANGAGE
ncbi:MAG: hypothetical protein OXG53_09650 [Chloroflexi bacterium]|nr:hypothetical protein [Chloroflexota bacterium]